MPLDVICSAEKTFFVESLRPMQVAQIGSKHWLEMHEKIINLSQQATLEATEQREEEIKELLIVHDKLKVLVHEAYCVLLWKTRVLPHLLDICPNPQATFLIYTVFFHEGAAISLLDTVLFHASTCEALMDCAIDLVDYCAQAVSQLIGLASMGFHEKDIDVDINESVLSELERQKRAMQYKIGLRCISILSYLADNISVLPISAARRMITTHDVPWLMADILNFAPWQRRLPAKGIEKFINEKWVLVEEQNAQRVVKHEAQAWFCLRQLLFNKAIIESYELNQERCQRLGACEGLLYDTIMDQLPPLVELKQYLCQLRIAVPPAAQQKSKADLLFEEIPEIQENLIKEADLNGGFTQIAQDQENIFINLDKEKTMELASRLSGAYNTDLLAEFEQKSVEEILKEAAAGGGGDAATAETIKPALEKVCHKCYKDAEKKCSKCRKVYYCSRECQMEDWPQHKKTCKPAAEIATAAN